MIQGQYKKGVTEKQIQRAVRLYLIEIARPLGVTQLAQHIGVDKASLHRILTGQKLPGLHTICQVCDYLKTPPNQFFASIEKKYFKPIKSLHTK